MPMILRAARGSVRCRAPGPVIAQDAVHRIRISWLMWPETRSWLVGGLGTSLAAWSSTLRPLAVRDVLTMPTCGLVCSPRRL